MPSDHGAKGSCQFSIVSHCPCSGHSGSTEAVQAHTRASLDDRQSIPSGNLTIAKLAEHDRQQTSVHATVNKGAETTSTLNKAPAARSLGIDALGLFEEERENAGGMTPMERFLAEKKTSTLAKAVADGKDEVKDPNRDLISLD